MSERLACALLLVGACAALGVRADDEPVREPGSEPSGELGGGSGGESGSELSVESSGESDGEFGSESGDESGGLPDIVFPDGAGLPAGAGDAATGATLYAARCASCHGAAGEGGSAPELVGDPGTLGDEYPDRGIGARWPYAPPLFDYVRRSMPPAAPGSLDADESYAVVARLLELNGLLAPGTRVDAAALAGIDMPVRDRFVDVDVGTDEGGGADVGMDVDGGADVGMDVDGGADVGMDVEGGADVGDGVGVDVEGGVNMDRDGEAGMNNGTDGVESR